MGTPAKSQTKTQKTWKFPAPKKEIREALEKAFEGRMERVTWKSTDRAIYGRDLWPRELLSLRRAPRVPVGPARASARSVKALAKRRDHLRRIGKPAAQEA